MADAYNKGRTGVQMGNNTSLVDFAYAGNVADAHVLAADRLRSDSADLVAGQMFFITNGEPLPYWNIPRMVWKEMGDDGKKKITALPKLLLLIIAYILELWYGFMGLEPPFRVFDVQFTTTEQWYNIDKVILNGVWFGTFSSIFLPGAKTVGVQTARKSSRSIPDYGQG
jgi:sterol-4alpha-carboxylate 3-dehydrogenase (decarboxylating)